MSSLLIIETILRQRTAFFRQIRDAEGVRTKLRAMLLSSAAFFALYGAVMGSSHSPAQALSSAVKLPLLFLATLAVCAPALYFLNLVFGSDQSLSQNVALILTAITVTAVLLMAFAPIALFFLLTASGYQVFKLLNVALLGIAGVIGVLFLEQGMRAVSPEAPAQRQGCSRAMLLWLWVLVYAFVGSQMAWTLRPFLGAPAMPFAWFRPLGGSFWANVLSSLAEIMGG